MRGSWANAQEAIRLAQRYAAVTPTARRHADLFDGVERFAMFVGYPRSGHSLVGALLDAHPEAAIAHEASALQYVAARFDRDRLFTVLLENSASYGAGRQPRGGYVYDVPGQWQGRFQRLRVIGDKKGEGAALRLHGWPWVLARLRQTVGVPLRVLHVVRNPFDNVATMARRAAEVSGRAVDLDASIGRYGALCESAAAVRQRVGPEEWVELRHEDLVARPATELHTLCGALGLEAPEGYLAACAGVVRATPHQSRHKVAWTPGQRDAVAELVDRFEPLSGYTFEA
mgnify:CR=1 FL=1